MLVELQLRELAEPAAVVIAHSLSVSEALQQGVGLQNLQFAMLNQHIKSPVVRVNAP